MSDDYEPPKPQLTFLDHVEYYDSTDFAQLYATVENDAYFGSGDVMLTLMILRGDGTTEQVYIPVNVQDSPAQRGTSVTFPVENATRQIYGDTQLSLIDVSGAGFSGADTWRVLYGPIRNPFEE
jgi:hypothetical protein